MSRFDWIGLLHLFVNIYLNIWTELVQIMFREKTMKFIYEIRGLLHQTGGSCIFQSCVIFLFGIGALHYIISSYYVGLRVVLMCNARNSMVSVPWTVYWPTDYISCMGSERTIAAILLYSSCYIQIQTPFIPHIDLMWWVGTYFAANISISRLKYQIQHESDITIHNLLSL